MVNQEQNINCPQERQLLESGVRLSECLLWQLQESFYLNEGLSAWNQVPFDITSRPTFADMYAELLLSFLLDHRDKLDFAEPLYIVELGAGLGWFSFRCLEELLAKMSSFDCFKSLKLRYIVSDFAENIVVALSQNPRLKRLASSGHLDFARFRPESDSSVDLCLARTSLRAGDCKNPLIAIANYVFDSIAQDAFCIENNQLFETRFDFFRQRTAGADVALPLRLEEIESSESYRAIDWRYYEDEVWNEVLRYYKENCSQATVLFPVGALRAIANLEALSAGKLVLLVADHGVVSPDALEMKGLAKHEYGVHDGAFSFLVNFDCLSRYFGYRGGSAFTQFGYSLCQAFYSTLPDRWQHVRYYFDQVLTKKDPANSLPMIHALLRQSRIESDDPRDYLRAFMSILKTCNYDPNAFLFCMQSFFSGMKGGLEQLDAVEKADLVQALKRVQRNISVDAKHEVQMTTDGKVLAMLNQLEELIEVQLGFS